MVQLRNGHIYSMDLAHHQDLAVMNELYPDLDPEVHRVSVIELVRLVDVIKADVPRTDEFRLHRFHRILELCTIEHEFEVQGYQAAHRRLLEYEGDLRELLQIPKMPSCAFEPWASYIDQQIELEKANMKHSRRNSKGLLKVISYAEEQVKKTLKVVAAQGKADRLSRESDLFVENQRARLAANVVLAEQVREDSEKQPLRGSKSSKGRQPACDSNPDR